jgi:hypothetical protein
MATNRRGHSSRHLGKPYLPARMTSTPAGNHRSPGLSSSKTVLAGSVRKYSASSTWVPSLSNTRRTGSPTETPSLSRPRCTSSSRLPTTSPLRTLRRPSHSLKGLFPRDSCNTPISHQRPTPTAVQTCALDRIPTRPDLLHTYHPIWHLHSCRSSRSSRAR